MSLDIFKRQRDNNEELDPMLSAEEPIKTNDNDNFSQSRNFLVWPWRLSTVLFTVATILLLFERQSSSEVQGWSYETGFATDLRPAREAIEIVPVRFTGALKFNASGDLIREVQEGQLDWAGTPTDEIDAAWQSIEDATGVFLDGEAADTVRNSTRFKDGYWISGLDVFHQFHCLNRLRKHIYGERYSDPDPPRNHQLHIEHCIDSIRQALLCHADMTEIHVLWYPEAQRYAPDFNAIHTCRNISRLLEWSWVRGQPSVRGSEIGVEHVMKGHN